MFKPAQASSSFQKIRDDHSDRWWGGRAMKRLRGSPLPKTMPGGKVE
jgi:hypothetical protein